MKKIIASPKAPAAVGPYSQAIYVNGTLYISGQIPINQETGTMAESIEDQAHQCFKNIGYILEAAGLRYKDVVKTTVLLANIADFAAVNAVYAQYFTEDLPARACFQVAALPKGAGIEVEAIACYVDDHEPDMAGE